MKTQIIYLNGASSSGKTTIAKALQEHLKEPFMLIGIDKIIGMMPERVNDWFGNSEPEGFSWKMNTDHTGKTTQELYIGPFGKKVTLTFVEIVLTMAKLGHHLIIDDVAFGKNQVDRWRKALKEYKVLYVGISAPVESLEEREQKRGNRIQGSARAQSSKVHVGVQYDLELDTSCLSVEDCVRIIQEKL